MSRLDELWEKAYLELIDHMQNCSLCKETKEIDKCGSGKLLSDKEAEAFIKLGDLYW